MNGGKITILGPNILKLAGSRIYDLDIAGDVAVAVDFTELVERLIRNLANI